MRFLFSMTAGAVLATLATAVAIPQEQAKPAPEVAIFGEPNFKGESLSFTPQGICRTIFPRIASVKIPENQDIYCQLFNNAACGGQGGDVIVSSASTFNTPVQYFGIICGVLS